MMVYNYLRAIPNKYNTVMIGELKRRVSKEVYGNQNYLNFIKKNHQLM